MFLWTVCLLLLPLTAQSIEYRWQDEAGIEKSITALKGKPVVLHFWASWCPPCRSEMPALVEWVAQHPETTVIMVSLDRGRESAEKFFASQGIALPLNMGNMRDASSLGVRGLPSTFIIGADGEVKKRHVGDINWMDKKSSDAVLAWL